MSVTHASFTLERRFPQTPAQAFSAFADPELKRRWFANPGGWPDGEGTRLLFSEQGAFLDGLDDPAGREHGTGKLLDALERFLASEPVR